MGGFGDSLSAWGTGIGAWGPVLLLMVAGGLVLATHMGVQIPQVSMIWLGLAAASLVIIVLRWLTLPDDGGIGELGLLGDTGIDSGAGFGLIVGLIAALVSGVAAFMVYRAAPNAGTTPQAGTAYGA